MFNSKMFTTLMVLLAVLAAGTALAGDAEWSFYGKLHSSINMMNNGENSQLGLSSNTSRYGFKGSNPLNEEFSFVWQFEEAINIAQGSLSQTLRNTYVGFRNADMGELRMGRHDTPHKTLGRKTTFFYDTVGDNRQMTFDTDTRESDMLMWLSPDWSGFGLFLAYQFDQNSDKLDTNVPADAEFYSDSFFSGMASYAKDEFFVGASMIMLGEAYSAAGGPALGDAPTVMRLAGKYDAEQFAFAASYLSIGAQDWDGAAYQDWTASTIGFEGLFKASENYNVKAGYYMADPDSDADDDDFNLITVGVDRNFGKNTQVYIQYAGLSYGDAADNWTMGGGDLDWLYGAGTNGFGAPVRGWTNTSTTPATFENPSGFSVGVNYKW